MGDMADAVNDDTPSQGEATEEEEHRCVTIPKPPIGSWDQEWWQAVCSCGWSSTLHHTNKRATKSARQHERAARRGRT